MDLQELQKDLTRQVRRTERLKKRFWHDCEGQHPPYDRSLGDRAVRTELEAMKLAISRANTRGPQAIFPHRSWMFKNGIWYVQDARSFEVTP